jgi:uncharacterized membrane protein
MHLLYRRYARSGYASPLFYILMALGFGGLAVYAAVRGDWLIAVIAALMIVAVTVGARVMRRMSDALADSSTRVEEMEDHHGR